MEWIISHESAIEFWRNANKENIRNLKKLQVLKPPVLPLDTKKAEDEKYHNLSIPLHVLVGSDNARKVTRSLKCHISSGEYPYGSFAMMPSGLIVSSPELCFLQMASKISFIELVRLGYEFCGSYRLDKRKGFIGGMPQLTNISKLNSYIQKSTGSHGRKTAIKALRFLIDGSASPMETILTMLLTLPYKLGGYGFPKPQLNYRIEVSDKVTSSKIKQTSRPTFYCDLYWPDKKIAVEYDSDEYHSGAFRIEKDAIRRNALESVGVRMITVSRRQLTDATKMREISEVLSRLLGKRLKYVEKEFISLNAELMRQLLPEDSIDKYL